ncbi:putative galacturonosyltransferase 4 isoform X4 [Carex littledalei]|uniref:Hexosyltransferase n=1 Tax=Carex littledalei TaxID=544730 RepID=A0A833QQ64_9POAL|nr:putative galacturonosyltransferase 4 isoform X4 [Carex littledalei]
MKMQIMIRRKVVFFLLCASVLAPIVFYTDRLSIGSNSILNTGGFGDQVTNLGTGLEITKLNVVRQELTNPVQEPIGVVLAAKLSNFSQDSVQKEDKAAEFNERGGDKAAEFNERGLLLTQPVELEHKNRVLSEVPHKKDGLKEVLIEQVTQNAASKDTLSLEESKEEKQPAVVQANKVPLPDLRVRQMKDQLIRARVYLGLSATRTNPHYIKELRLRIRDVQRALGEATKDSDLPRNANDKLKAMEETLARGKQIQEDCAGTVKKLRAMLHSAEELLRVHKKQTLFLTQLAAKTLPKGLHCLPLRLSSEYYNLEPAKREFGNKEKLEDPSLYHYALFSDNVLATAVVVNSTVTNAKHPGEHVFHIVTDRLNYPAMRMWFLANPPRHATIQVQNIDDLTWLNSSYSPVLKQLSSQSMIDYYFRAHKSASNPDSNLKYRNPKYLSILNHLRFYLPQIFPKLNKVVFLDDDIVVQKDLTGLWRIDMKGKVIGVVETCGESFHRFDRYLNFSNPIIAKNFDPRACGWAFGMNLFDLDEWRRQNITEIYHSWQNLNEDRLLWKLGTLPPGLITFYNQTVRIDRLWHVLGLGYNPHVNARDIDRAAVIHYNGNMKPWLEIGLPRYRGYWSKYVDYDQIFLHECNINP